MHSFRAKLKTRNKLISFTNMSCLADERGGKFFGQVPGKIIALNNKHSRKPVAKILAPKSRRDICYKTKTPSNVWAYRRSNWIFYVLTRPVQNQKFFSWKTKMFDACIRIQLGMHFARAICCFGEPRGREEHLSNGKPPTEPLK